MKAWMKTAKQELKEMRSLASALPLMESLQKSFAIINKSKAEITVFDSLIKIEALGNVKNPDRRLLDAIMVLGCGADIEIATDEISNELGMAIEKERIPEHLYTTASDTLACVGSMNDNAVILRKETDGVVESTLLEQRSILERESPEMGGERRSFVRRRSMKMINKSKERAIDLAIASKMLIDLSQVLSADELFQMIRITEIGIPEIKRFAFLDLMLQREQNGKRAAYMIERAKIAFPAGLEEMRAGLEEPKRRDPRIMVECPGEDFLEAGSGKIEPPKRPRAKDAAILEDRFPNLYRRMLCPNRSEQETNALKNMVHRLHRMGIGFDFIAASLSSGTRHEDTMISEYLRCHEDARPKLANRMIALKKVFKRGESPAESAPASSALRQAQSKEEFLTTISFSEATSSFICGKGFEPKDIVFAICKGFDFGKGMSCTSGAVGGAHYRGAIIRRNLRRYLLKAHDGTGTRPPDADKIIVFLKSVDLVREFGSGPSTKTKDEAMSINTNPAHPIGQDILRTMNSAFVDLKKNGSDAPSSRN